MDLIINSKLKIPSEELCWKFFRSSGKGGQHVNKVETAVQLAWSVSESKVVGPFKKQRLFTLYQAILVNGNLIVTSSEERTQILNRRIALKKLRNLILEGLKAPPPKRRETLPTTSSKRKRVEQKKRRGEIKKSRQSMNQEVY